MRSTLTAALAALALGVLALSAAPPAEARYRVGIGDQHPEMFAHPAWQKLKLKRVRYIVPWDAAVRRRERGIVDHFVNAARSARVQLFVAFNHSRYNPRRLPGVRSYRRAFRAFRKRYPDIRVISPWNEINHRSQPTRRSPRRAAQYYKTVRRHCRRCTVVAADVLDQRGVVSYLKRFRRHARSARLWGLHNYSDTNRRRGRGTRSVLRTVPGQVWLTETGGVVKFGRSWPYSPRRAASRIRYMFRLADTYTKRRRGLRSRITRLYPYAWTGARRSARFDAGLTNPNGSLRPGYRVFKRFVARRPR